MPDVIMPRLSDSMEEGTILRWLKATGETVQRGEDLLEIETDKATMTYEADASGVLTIGVEDGATVPVGAVIGSIGDATETTSPAAVQPPGAREPLASSPGAGGQVTLHADGQTTETAATGTNGHDRTSVTVPAVPVARPAKASPLARRTARSL